jgi:hypothetical protein
MDAYPPEELNRIKLAGEVIYQEADELVGHNRALSYLNKEMVRVRRYKDSDAGFRIGRVEVALMELRHDSTVQSGC